MPVLIRVSLTVANLSFKESVHFKSLRLSSVKGSFVNDHTVGTPLSDCCTSISALPFLGFVSSVFMYIKNHSPICKEERKKKMYHAELYYGFLISAGWSSETSISFLCKCR